MIHAALRYGILLYFAGRLCFFALGINHELPPDEWAHLGVVKLYSQTPLLSSLLSSPLSPTPLDSPETLALGPIGDQPYLYYLIFGQLLKLNFLPLPSPVGDLVFLRLLNAMLGLATAIYCARWVAEIGGSPLAQNLTLLLASNTLMFTGISSAVNYDNLVNLLAAAAFLHLFRWLAKQRPADLLWLVVLSLAGCLTKNTFLPLGLLFALVGLLGIGRGAGWRLPRASWPSLRASWLSPRVSWFSPRVRWAALARLSPLEGLRVVALLWLLAATLFLYGGNLVHHGKLVPGLEDLVGEQAASANRLVARSRILDDYREGHVGFRDSLLRAHRIQHQGDSGSTKVLLALMKRIGDRRHGIATYAYGWSRIMTQRIFGYFGHRVLRRSLAVLGIYAGIFSLALIFYAMRCRAPGLPRRLGVGLFIGLAYAAILMLAVNWRTYQQMGLPDLAVQGRYLFIVLAPLWGFVAVSIADLAPRRLRLPLALAVAGFFLYGDLPFFLANASPEWYGADVMKGLP